MKRFTVVVLFLAIAFPLLGLKCAEVREGAAEVFLDKNVQDAARDLLPSPFGGWARIAMELVGGLLLIGTSRAAHVRGKVIGAIVAGVEKAAEKKVKETIARVSREKGVETLVTKAVRKHT